MEQYIPKSALVAEIEKIIHDETESVKCFERGKNGSEVQRSNARMAVLVHIRSLLNTLDVKEVDLEKAFDEYTLPIGAQDIREAPFTSLAKCAKHFFELGLSINNPITAADRGTAEEIIINLKRVENDYHISLTREMEWLRNKVKKG